MKKILAIILLMVVIVFARTAVPFNQYRPFEIQEHNINNIQMCVSNYGKFGQTQAGNAGLWWPKASGQNYIFGAGSWFGTIDGGDTLVTIGYGPHGGEAEYAPGLKDMSTGDPNAQIFFYPAPWPPPPDVFPMAPQSVKSHQDSWCVYNDLDPNYHMPGDTRPIGLEVYQTVYAWNLTTTADIIFIRYELKNVSGKKLTDCYFGVCTDNDIGNEAGTGNDIISAIVGQWYVIEGESVWIDNLGYQWQVADEPGWDDVGAIGFDYLQSPWDLKEGQDKDNDGILDQYERDSAYYYNNLPDSLWDVDKDGTPDWRDPSQIPQLGMSAFKRFTLNLEPNKDNERYVTLAGYHFKTGNYEPFDTIPPQPDDQRFLQCSGPFELEADSIAIVLVGIMCTYWPRGIVERPDTALAKLDKTVQFIYDMNWLLPGPPPPPNLTCIPGDAKITLIWDNKSEVTSDPYYDVVGNPTSPIYDPYYKQYDFEGYRVWRSVTGKTGSWKLLASFDLTNGITFKDTTMPDSIALNAIDNGVIHSFVDTDVRNGFNYYYAVTAFDYNLVKDMVDSIFLDTFYVQPGGDTVWDYDTVKVEGPRVLYFESGLTGVTATPRRDPVNYVAGSCSVSVKYGNPFLVDSIVRPMVTYPFNMSTEPIFVEFGPIRYDSATTNAIYSAYLKNSAGNVVDSMRSIIPNAKLKTFYEFIELQGLNIKVYCIHDSLGKNDTIFSKIEVISGSYPETLLTTMGTSDNWNYWAYRGNNYKITWKAKSGSGPANTIEVYDLMANQVVPYSGYKDTVTHKYDSLANGWCFQSLRGFSDTLVLNSSQPSFFNTKHIYICGGRFNLKKGGFLTSTDILPAVNDEWIVYANDKLPAASAYGEVQIHSIPSTMLSDTTLALNVKVVPNPYLVHNEWQQSSLIRRLRFINLPGECTIRIFTLNGELIKTIKHSATIGSVQGDAGGDEWWDLLTENRQLVASGVYIFHVDSKVGEQVGKFVVIR